MPVCGQRWTCFRTQVWPGNPNYRQAAPGGRRQSGGSGAAADQALKGPAGERTAAQVRGGVTTPARSLKSACLHGDRVVVMGNGGRCAADLVAAVQQESWHGRHAPAQVCDQWCIG